MIIDSIILQTMGERAGKHKDWQEAKSFQSHHQNVLEELHGPWCHFVHGGKYEFLMYNKVLLMQIVRVGLVFVQ